MKHRLIEVIMLFFWSACVVSSQQQIVNHATFYSKGSYSAFAIIYSVNSSYVLGTDYDAKWTLTNTAVFPNQTLMNWYVPKGPIPVGFGVWGYLHIDYGNYDGDYQQTAVTSSQIGNINTFTTVTQWNYSNSANFNLLHELWLTKDRRLQSVGSSGDALWEIGFLMHSAATGIAFHNSGILIGSTHVNNGITYTARLHNVYITFMKVPVNGNSDVFTPTVDWKAVFQFLITNEILTGAEWVNGIAIGIEPDRMDGTGTHGGTWNLSNFITTLSSNHTPLSADYGLLPGENVFGSTQGSAVNADIVTGQSDINNGTSAIFLKERNTTTSPSYLYSLSLFPQREMDYLWYVDVKNNKGRNSMSLSIQATSTNQISSLYNLTSLTKTQSFSPIGTGLTALSREMVDMENGWRRAFFRFRKAAGITSLSFNIEIRDNANNLRYAGDITKGLTISTSSNRLKQDLRVFVSGAPATAYQGAAYSFIPAVRGGRGTLTFSSIGSTLPTGLGLSTSTGEISGTPTTTGSFSGIVIRVSDQDVRVADLPINITVVTDSSWFNASSYALYSAMWDFNNNRGFLPAVDANNQPIYVKSNGVYPKRTCTFSQFFQSGALNTITTSNRTQQQITTTKLRFSSTIEGLINRAAGTIISKGNDKGTAVGVIVGGNNGYSLIGKEQKTDGIYFWNGANYLNRYGTPSLSPGPVKTALSWDVSGIALCPTGNSPGVGAFAMPALTTVYLGAGSGNDNLDYAVDYVMLSAEKINGTALQSAVSLP